MGGAAGAAEKVAVAQAPRGGKAPLTVWELQRRRRCSAENRANEAQKGRVTGICGTEININPVYSDPVLFMRSAESIQFC